MNLIQPDSIVILHINMKLSDGSIADSTRASHKPALLHLGQGEVTQAFEMALQGMVAGDKKKFTLPPEDAFGWANPANFHRLPRSRFPQTMVLELDQIIECEQLTGPPLLGVVRELAEETVLLDFNHPLAGQAITFEVEIIEVRNEGH